MPTEPTPTVSVLLPVYNAGRYLDAAVRSILDQTLTDFELIALDDGSTDGSLDVLRAHADRDRRLRLISRENRGLVATLGELIEAARGPLLARMDADDIALPERFEHQVAFMSAHPRTVCIGGGVVLIDEDDRVLHHPPPVLGDRHVQRSALEGRMPICHPAAMFRAEGIERVGGYRSEAYPSEDLDLWLRLGEIGELDNVPQTVLRYRVHSTSISVQQSQRQTDKMREACESAWKRRGITGGIFRGVGQPPAQSSAPGGQETSTPGAAGDESQPPTEVEVKPGDAAPSHHNPTAQSLMLASKASSSPAQGS